MMYFKEMVLTIYLLKNLGAKSLKKPPLCPTPVWEPGPVYFSKADKCYDYGNTIYKFD